MAKDKWTIYITETIRHEIVVEIDKEQGQYPYEEPRRVAKATMKEMQKDSKKSSFEIEQICRDKPEAHCYFDAFGDVNSPDDKLRDDDRSAYLDSPDRS